MRCWMVSDEVVRVSSIETNQDVQAAVAVQYMPPHEHITSLRHQQMETEQKPLFFFMALIDIFWFTLQSSMGLAIES
ncbi:hypothetical protein chiPu_0007055 [Chiloscyllium punctatum]|uniref:Uncharacterized protein n=1 Tax=Chiloscyllium punctatum TaxID=137246 RepID=A0A401SE46_CHIPU|nr:hypothetical protein [Chiloscyllium punctatum]